MAAENQSALDYIQELSECHFWGFLTFKFEDGRVVHIRREENLKPNELPGKNRGSQYDRNKS